MAEFSVNQHILHFVPQLPNVILTQIKQMTGKKSEGNFKVLIGDKKQSGLQKQDNQSWTQGNRQSLDSDEPSGCQSSVDIV